MVYRKPTNISKHDIHPLDGLFYYIGSRLVMIPLWVLSVAVGIFISLHFDDWTWLPRFGAIGVMIATILTLSPLFRRGIYLSNADVFGLAGLDEDNKPMATSPEGRSISINIVIGVVLIIVSSVINAFGDYLAGLIL